MRYHQAIARLLTRIVETQAEPLERAARTVFASLREEGILHIFGSGHSHAVAEEAFHRAGGLVPVNVIQEVFLTPLTSPLKSGPFERLSGIAAILLDAYDCRRGEVLIVVSNSGINPVPVEMALGGRERGLTVVAITSVTHSQQVPSRHASGRRLFEVADILLDTCGALGDAVVTLPGLAQGVGPTSLIAGAFLVNALACRVVECYLAAGLNPPIYRSANVPEGDRHNRELEARYRLRIKGL